MKDESDPLTLGSPALYRTGLGTLHVTEPGEWGPRGHDGAVATLPYLVKFGVDFMDAAVSYGPKMDDELIGEALFPYETVPKILTKAGFTRATWDPRLGPSFQNGASNVVRMNPDAIKGRSSDRKVSEILASRRKLVSR